ncbi:MAG: hypothetical protein HXS50_04600, partial [Theionarchaea archaeon]|nr:hypothetical protein [Theionarchaea archaeon]
VALRFVRAYLPRKYSDLVSGTDAMLFHDYSPKIMTPKYLEWFRQGVYDGVGLTLVEFAQRISACGMEYWQDTVLYEAFPAELAWNCIEAAAGRQYYRVVKQSPLTDFPKMEDLIINWGHHGDLYPREGATTWAIWRGRGTPALVSQTYGNGTVLHYDHGWDTMPEDVKRTWRYLPDYIFNHLCFVTGLQFPDDLELTHEVRALFASLDKQSRMAISVLEFIDKFGANTRQFELTLSGLRDEKEAAEKAYLEGDLNGAADMMRELNDRVVEMSNEMMKAKDRAMFWIFVIEWLSVTATGMFCGFVLWSLMVRRRLYREVGETRLSQASESDE